MKEVKFKKDYLNDEDVFLIDLGLKIYQVYRYLILVVTCMHHKRKQFPQITVQCI